jgi:hypothetical protein
LKEDQAVVLKREPRNAYDRFAIKIFAQHSGRLYDVGYVPREITPTLAPLMDLPHKYIATCTKILENDRLIPVIDLVLYGPNADFDKPIVSPVIVTSQASRTCAELEAAMQGMPTVRTPCEIDERPPTARPNAHHGQTSWRSCYGLASASWSFSWASRSDRSSLIPFPPQPPSGRRSRGGHSFPRGTIPATIYPDMALRFHRSMKVFPGVRLNFGGPASLGAENRNRIP